jgi:hypothetical protein
MLVGCAGSGESAADRIAQQKRQPGMRRSSSYPHAGQRASVPQRSRSLGSRRELHAARVRYLPSGSRARRRSTYPAEHAASSRAAGIIRRTRCLVVSSMVVNDDARKRTSAVHINGAVEGQVNENSETPIRSRSSRSRDHASHPGENERSRPLRESFYRHEDRHGSSRRSVVHSFVEALHGRCRPCTRRSSPRHAEDAHRRGRSTSGRVRLISLQNPHRQG